MENTSKENKWISNFVLSHEKSRVHADGWEFFLHARQDMRKKIAEKTDIFFSGKEWERRNKSMSNFQGAISFRTPFMPNA